MIQYLYMMMSSWSLVCDVWYLPPMNKAHDESAIDFANRVKAVIAKQGGLVDLAWYVFYFTIEKSKSLTFFFVSFKGRTTEANESQERMETKATRRVQ